MSQNMANAPTTTEFSQFLPGREVLERGALRGAAFYWTESPLFKRALTAHA